MEHKHYHLDHKTLISNDFYRILHNTDFQVVSDIFKQLSDPVRLQIYWLLCHHEECVTNISSLVSMSSPAVSHHLRILKSSGLVTSYRKGKEVFYMATDNPTCKELHHIIEAMIMIHCPQE